MLFFGRQRWVKGLCHPWLIPPLLGGLHIYTVYLLFTITSAPEVPDPSMKGMREFWSQPFLFLSLWAHRMILDLFCGMMLNRTKEGEGTAGKISLLLIWILGPVGLMVFAVRYWANVRGAESLGDSRSSSSYSSSDLISVSSKSQVLSLRLCLPLTLKKM